MSKLDGLIKLSSGAAAGAAILESMRALRREKQHDAADILAAEYERIRAKAQADAIDHSACFVPSTEADIIAEALRPELPKSWPFPKNAEEALV